MGGVPNEPTPFGSQDQPSTQWQTTFSSVGHLAILKGVSLRLSQNMGMSKPPFLHSYGRAVCWDRLWISSWGRSFLRSSTPVPGFRPRSNVRPVPSQGPTQPSRVSFFPGLGGEQHHACGTQNGKGHLGKMCLATLRHTWLGPYAGLEGLGLEACRGESLKVFGFLVVCQSSPNAVPLPPPLKHLTGDSLF